MLGVLAAVAPARADEPSVLSGGPVARPSPVGSGPDGSPTQDAHALAAPPLLSPGALVAALAVESEGAADRLDVIADVWYGVSDRLTLGVVHGHRGLGAPGVGRGVCARGCLAGDDRYRGVALAARFPLGGGATRLVGEIATDVAAWSPARASMQLGLLAHWRDRRVWAQAAARLAVGLLGRADGNRELIHGDAVVGILLGGPITLELGVGMRGPASEDFFGDATAPLWTQLVGRVSSRWAVGALVGVDQALGDRAVLAALTVELRAAR